MNSLYNTIKFEDVYILNSLSILQWISFMQILINMRPPCCPWVWSCGPRTHLKKKLAGRNFGGVPYTACFSLLIFLINSFNNIQWITLFLNNNLWSTLTITVFIHYILQSKQLYKCPCLTSSMHRRSTKLLLQIRAQTLNLFWRSNQHEQTCGWYHASNICE